MLIWIVAILAVVIGYFYFILTTSSGSSYKDNSIDAFIDSDFNESSKHIAQTTKSSTDRYRTNYTVEGRQLLIVYGTEYGFSEEVARKLFDRILEINISCQNKKDPPFQPRLVNAKDFKYIDWNQEQVCFIIISTSGDGVPPTDARSFFDHFVTSTEPLGHLSYSVLALGDSNYPQFCKTGRIIDKRMHDLSALCISDRCDVDMEDWSVINGWMDSVLKYLMERLVVEPQIDYLDHSNIDSDGLLNRHNPFMATLKVKNPLTVNTCTDDKETIHCEFDVTGSGLTWTSGEHDISEHGLHVYCPSFSDGDALGIYPQNNQLHAEAILRLLKHDGKQEVDTPVWAYKPCGEILDLQTALLKFYDLKHVKAELLLLLSESVTDLAEKNIIQNLFKNGVSKNNTFLHEYLSEREVIDVLMEFTSHNINPQQLLQCLKQLQPRYYSISSSPLEDSNTVCVTAAVVRYMSLGHAREGVTTTYLQDRFSVGSSCPVFMSRNPDFRLPSDSSLPVILIGPGTGIAPFRAFIQEKALEDNPGSVHLYFGCRHREKDYLYREELESWENNGLIRLRVAFSRDQEYKVYVQDLLLEDSRLLWQLIDQGHAHIYVCGDAKHMAHDVHQALCTVIQTNGLMDTENATEYLQTLEKNLRYQKDVWVT